MQLTWKIESLECTPGQGNFENVVSTVHWRLLGEDAPHVTSVYGSVNLSFDSGPAENFTLYKDLEQSTVLDWAKTAIGEEQVAAYETAVELQIEQLKHPAVVNKPLPW